jgi:hypothetical protein
MARRALQRQGQGGVDCAATETTKTDRMRTIPASERLVKLLARRRNGPDGERHAAGACIFDAVGERLVSIKTAWKATCRRAGVDD